MADREGNVLKPPGFSVKAVVTEKEVLASMAGLTQRGVTLVGGQGVLPAGTVLYQVAAGTKYTRTATGNGNAQGILRNSVDTSDGDMLGNIILSGRVKLDHLLAEDGTTQLTGGALTTVATALNASTRPGHNMFVF